MTQLKESYAQTVLRQSARSFKSAVLVILCAVDNIALYAVAPELPR